MHGFLKLTWTELKLFARDPFATVFSLALPLIMLLLLAAVFGDTPATDTVEGMPVFRGVPGDDYYVPASVAIVVAAIGLLILPTHLAGYREVGVLRRFRASSVPAWVLLASQLVVGLIVAVAGSLLMMAIATPIHDTMLPDDWIGVGVALLVSIVTFTAIGFALAAVFPSSRAAQGIGLIVFFVIWLLSGAAPPRAVLPEGVRDAGQLDPLTHVVIAVQDPWFGYGWNGEKLLILAGIAVVAAVVGTWRFAWD
jgi:ABC-2 type transport system permease protein